MKFDSFESQLKSYSKSLHSLYDKEQVRQPKLNTSWFGVRQGIEVPQSHTHKELGSEFLNRNFMYSSDYYKYKDWKEIMGKTYNSFDLNILPEQGNKQGEAKYYHQDSGR